MVRRVRTVDAHAGGEPLRLVVEGFPAPVGASMLDKRAWVRRRHDGIRRALMREPRGHADMYGAVFTEPVSGGRARGRFCSCTTRATAPCAATGSSR